MIRTAAVMMPVGHSLFVYNSEPNESVGGACHPIIRPLVSSNVDRRYRWMQSKAASEGEYDNLAEHCRFLSEEQAASMVC